MGTGASKGDKDEKKKSSTCLSRATQREKKVFLAQVMLSSAHWVMKILMSLNALLVCLKWVEKHGVYVGLKDFHSS